MLNNVSPYALLRASIPQRSGSATPYDLYSLAQSSESSVQAAPVAQVAPVAQAAPVAQVAPAAAAIQAVPDAQAASAQTAPDTQEEQAAPAVQTVPDVQPVPDMPAALPYAPRVPARRTHYISDIKSRHTAAAKQAAFSDAAK